MITPTTDLDLRNQIADALSNAGAFCGNCGFEPGDRGECADCESCWSSYADALMPLFVRARGVTFREAARLLESTGRDDDAVNLLDNMGAAHEPGGTAYEAAVTL